jgi:hypothetical protein
MRKLDYLVLTCVICSFVLFGYNVVTQTQVVQAQVAPTTLTFHAVSDHTKCSLAQTAQSDGRGPGACFATDGVWVQGSNDITPWQLTKPSNAPQTVTINNKLPDASGNFALKISDLPGILTPSQDMITRSCPITGMIVGSTGDTIKLGSCGN